MSDKRWTLLEVLEWTSSRFARQGIESPRLDAEVLLAHALGVERIRLYMDFDKPLAAEELSAFRAYVRRRLAREPVAYIVGEREFWSLPLFVEAGVLIPRPETELLVEEALKWRKEVGCERPRVVDVGTGAGAIALALGHEWPEAQVIALDVQWPAVRLAAKNARRHGRSLQLLQGDLLGAFGPSCFDLVMANLPYIPAGDAEQLMPEVVRFEPAAALFGGEDGLGPIRRLLPQARRALRSGGGLFLEMDPRQTDKVAVELAQRGFVKVAIQADLAGSPRVVSAIQP